MEVLDGVSIAQLNRSPGKSMRAKENVQALNIDANGLFGDREYMWVEVQPHVNTANYHKGDEVPAGTFLSQREDPVLTSIIPTIYAGHLDLVHEGRYGRTSIPVPRVEETEETLIPVHMREWHGLAIDQGNRAAAWGSEIVGRAVRLVAVSRAHPRFVENDPELGQVGFSDGYPIHVTSEESVAELNRYLEAKGRPPVPANRFRSVFHLKGFERPFQEDFIDEIIISFDGLELVLERIKACGRCPITDTDQQTGDLKTYVRSALGKLGRTGRYNDAKRYGTEKKLFFGQNFIIRLPKGMPRDQIIPVTRDTPLQVVLSDETNWYRPDGANAETDQPEID